MRMKELITKNDSPTGIIRNRTETRRICAWILHWGLLDGQMLVLTSCIVRFYTWVFLYPRQCLSNLPCHVSLQTVSASPGISFGNQVTHGISKGVVNCCIVGTIVLFVAVVPTTQHTFQVLYM